MHRPDRRRAGATAAVVGVVALLVVVLSGCSGAHDPATAVARVHDMRAAPCAADALSVTVAGRDGASLPSAPASDRPAELSLVFTNTGSERCSLQGWPTVRYGSGDHPVGREALPIRFAPHPSVTVLPGTTAQAYLTLRESDSVVTCPDDAPDSLEVVAPTTHAPLRTAVPAGFSQSACAAGDDTLLSVQAVIPM